MAFSNVLETIARTFLTRERDRLGITGHEQAAQSAQLQDMVRQAQIAKALQDLELGPAEQESQIGLRTAQTAAAQAQAESYLALAGQREAGGPPPNTGSFEDYVIRKFGQRPTPEQIEQARKLYNQADDRPRQGPSTVITSTAESNILNRLVGQWDKAISPARELLRQSKLMHAGLEAARRGDMAAGSQAVLVTFQKILDPTSVVRESEYARSAAGQAVLSRIQGFAERLAQGGAGVPLEELERFAALADQFVKASAGGYTTAVKSRIGRTAKRYNIPEDLVFDDFDYGGAAGSDVPPAAPAGGLDPAVQNILNMLEEQ